MPVYDTAKFNLKSVVDFIIVANLRRWIMCSQEARGKYGKIDPRQVLLPVLLTFCLVGLVSHQIFDSGIHGGDFRTIFDAARALRKGFSEYAAPPGEVRYVYSPLIALALHPLARMSPDHAVQVWFWIEVAFFLGSIAVFALASDIGLTDSAPLATLFLVAFYSRPTWLELRHGQFDAPLLFLLAAAYLADRGGRFYRLAALVAVAALIKTWMIGLLFYLILRRRPLAFLAGLAFFFVGLAGLFTIVGWHEAVEFGRITTTYLHRANDFNNQSILGFGRLRFMRGDAVQPIMVSAPMLHGFVGAAFALLGWGMWAGFRVGEQPGPVRSRLMLSITTVSLLLALPFCERYYFILLFPSIWTLLTDKATSHGARWATLAIYFIFTFAFVPPAGMATGWEAWSCSAFFFATAALWMVLFLRIRAEIRRQIPLGTREEKI